MEPDMDPNTDDRSWTRHLSDAQLTRAVSSGACGPDRAREMRRARDQAHHRLFLIPSPSPLTSISDVVLSWSRGEWLIIDSHSYHPDFYINWRLRKLVGAVMSGEVYRALGPDGEVYRVEGWETEHKEQEESL